MNFLWPFLLDLPTGDEPVTKADTADLTVEPVPDDDVVDTRKVTDASPPLGCTGLFCVVYLPWIPCAELKCNTNPF